MTSLYDISFDFLNKYYNIEPAGNIKKRVIQVFGEILDKGWTSEVIKNTLDNIPADGNIPNPYLLFPNTKEDNLLKVGEFYYHNLLRCCPPPSLQHWDVNTGEITLSSEPFYLEMRASITLEQVIEYYSYKLGIKVDSGNFNRYKGSFKYMINKHGIDLVLFMIDVTKDMIDGEGIAKPSTPVGVAEYIIEAEARLNSKKDENRATEDDKIVAKRRIFSNRSGC